MIMVTFLGLIGGSVDKEGGVNLWENYEGAQYTLSSSLGKAFGLKTGLKKERYDNMLPLLRENFPNNKCIAVGTKESIVVQKALLAQRGEVALDENIEFVVLDSDADYDGIFRTLNTLLENEDKMIVDISHSFRHLPILMVVNLIIENIANPNKIEHILFAKELAREKAYEIVDLRRYLDLSGLSYALSGFIDNYTVASNIRLVDKDHQSLLNLLREVGSHLLGNSLEMLFSPDERGGDPLIKKVLRVLDAVGDHTVVLTVERYLAAVKAHMRELDAISAEPYDRRYSALAKMMHQKGYLLNAVTLLDEAVAVYCLEGLRKSDALVTETIEIYEKELENPNVDRQKYSRYILLNESKNLVKFQEGFRGTFLYSQEAKKQALVFLNRQKTQQLVFFIRKLDNVRNNLAHGNSDGRIEDVRKEIGRLLQRHNNICMQNDPLKRFVK